MAYVRVHIRGENFRVVGGTVSDPSNYSRFGSIDGCPVYSAPGLSTDPSIQDRLIMDISEIGDRVDLVCLTEDLYRRLLGVKERVIDRIVDVHNPRIPAVVMGQDSNPNSDEEFFP